MNKKKERKKRAGKVRLLGRMLALLPVTCALIYPVYLAAQLDTCREEYKNPRIPEEFAGMKIAFVSDIHFGTFLKEERVRELVAKVNELRADVIFLGGDYGEDSQGALDFWRLCPGFSAPYGVYAVMGNHDRTLPESNFEKLVKAMNENGVRPLVNEAVYFKKDGSVMAVAGVDDFYNGYPDLEKTAAACREADFSIFLSHSPDILPETYALHGGPFYQLALCGHTHGGQVRLFGHALKSSSDYGDRFLSGWYRENEVDILVSNGVGTSMLPVRFEARPQIHLITLKNQ